VAVASAGLYASLHLIPDNRANILPLTDAKKNAKTNTHNEVERQCGQASEVHIHECSARSAAV